MKPYYFILLFFLGSLPLFSQQKSLRLSVYTGPTYNITTQTSLIQLGAVVSTGTPRNYSNWQYGLTLEALLVKRLRIISDVNFRPSYRYKYSVYDSEDTTVFGPITKVSVISGDELTASALISYSFFERSRISLRGYLGPGVSFNLKSKSDPVDFSGRFQNTADFINAMYEAEHPPTFMGSVGVLLLYNRFSLRLGYLRTLSNSNTSPINVETPFKLHLVTI
jgi:hypothetical protein